MDRPPLDIEALRRGRAEPWTRIEVVEQTESTNADLIGAAALTPSGAVRVAEHQRAGRGRLARGWTSPPRAGLTFSVLLRPSAPAATWGWLPLLAGVALRDAVAEAAGVAAVLKWPNDLLAGPGQRKAAGILVQVADDAAVIGVGLNVTTTEAELALPTATSLAAEGATVTDRSVLLAATLAALGRHYRRWQRADGDAEASGLAAEYRACCATIGERVRVSALGGTAPRGPAELSGLAAGIDGDGRLRLIVDGRERLVAAGDVEHVRAAGQ